MMPCQIISSALIACLLSLPNSSALPASADSTAAKPLAFFLAGDSTTAKQTASGGGWGDGFLNTTLQNGAIGKNFGRNGATTVSFTSGGDWANVLEAATNAVPSSMPYVTIQFGHNDQKPEKGISMTQFTANLVKLVDEVRAVPATPIIVTSLSRRRFSGSGTGAMVADSLADVTAAAKAAAEQSSCDIIDLNGASMKYLNQIGSTNAESYNLDSTDFTHLNSQGSVVFGNLVALLIRTNVPATADFVQPEQQIDEALKAGQYYFPATCTGAFCGKKAQ